MVAALHFIFLNSAKYDVDSQSVLPNELQQLGLPKDICTAIVRAFQQAREALRAKLANNVLSRQCSSTAIGQRSDRQDVHILSLHLASL
jgi:hypothetical protein